MDTLPLAHSAALMAQGFHALGSIPTPAVTTHYFVHAEGCLLASVEEQGPRTRLREYLSEPLEILAVATLCLGQHLTDRVAAVHAAHQQLTLWGVRIDHAAHATKNNMCAAGSLD